MSIDSESLLAVTGCSDPEVTPDVLDRALGVPVRLANRARAVLMGGDKHAWAPQKHVDAERLRDRLSVEATELPGQELLPELLQAEWLLEVNEGRRSLIERWPALHLQGGLDSREPPLAFDRAQDWLSLVTTVDDPFAFMTQLELGAALPEHVDVLRQNYPELSDLITQAMFATITEMAGKGRDLAPGRERNARLWLGIEESVPLAEAASPEKKPEAPPQPASKQSEDVKTQSQKAGM